MALPSPPGPSTPPSAQQWAEDVTDTAHDHDDRLEAVEAVAAAAVPKAGGTMTGPLVLASDPVEEMEAATRRFVLENAGAGPDIDGDTINAAETSSSGQGAGAYIDLATPGPAATIDVPTSGRVLVIFGARAWSSTGGGNRGAISFALSGENTVAADDDNGFDFVGGSSSAPAGSFSRAVLLTGLTPGSTTFTMKYRATNTTTGTVGASHRSIIAEAKP